MSALNLNIELYAHPITFSQNKAETNALRKVFIKWHMINMKILKIIF
jgi:hypothetical protein